MPTYRATDLPTYLPTCLPTYLPTYLNLPTYLPTLMPTYRVSNLPTYLQCKTKFVNTLIKWSLQRYKMAFCIAFLVQERFPLLPAYLLTPFPPKQCWKQIWVRGMVNSQHCLGGGGLKHNFVKNCVKCPNNFDPHCLKTTYLRKMLLEL